MPVPEGIISTSAGPVDPTEVVQEVVPVVVETSTIEEVEDETQA